MKAIFKAQAKGLLEKDWVHAEAEVPEGWHTTRAAALDAWAEPPKNAPKPPRRTSPRCPVLRKSF
jgi:hypothetical protein